ncbi:hypothetical protein CERZMDRAFT_103261 [Cercospora zeae-maydis SCOH1-5]|uniref:Uncharacterized protein n=1 Tax=Cercospora zeae-maydis SCOH1-5 TaxID=717836 RepID=A0A6A6F2Q9_9PEZI|nr:hypothetical protein CERZMDRAFT_103261 [Cercospora zeae-maydis SCOH1-5]
MAQDPTDTVLGFLSSDESFIQPTSGTWNLDTCEQSNHDEISSLPHHEPALSPSAFSYQDTLRNVIHSRKLEGLLDDELETTIEKAWSSWSTPEGRRSAGVQRAVLLDYTGAKSALHALCNSPFRGARCINHATLAKMAEEVLEDHNCHAKRIITVHAAIATGIILEQAENSCEERRTIALAHYRHAFAHLTAAMHLSRADVDQLLDNACARAQALAIHFRPSHSSAHNEVHDDADTDELRNIFWLLYSIEKPARMEAGYISALNDNLINAELPSNLSHPFEDSDYEFLTHIGLSQICSQMLEKLYSQTGSCASQVSLAEEIHVLLTNVANWTQEARQVRMHNPASLSCSTTWTLYLLLLNVYSRSLVLSPTSITLQSAEQAVSDMTSEILDSLIHKDPLTVHEDADFLRAALTAFCISASSFRKAPDSTAQLRQLGFALGFFARLDPDFEFPWRECGSVLRLLQKGSTAHMHTR